jgi:alpha-D-ribose 1-methylphosphonate 5-triphosphate synthase subunit PhnH
MVLSAEALAGGFENPVLESQAVFRALMDAMARPGTVHMVDVAVDAPQPFSRAQAALALCLADHDTPVWLSRPLVNDALCGWLAFHSGAPVTAVMQQARFAFFGLQEPLPDFSGFAAGSQDYPDRSATLVIELPSLDGGDALLASGPGIDGELVIAPAGLPAMFVRRWAANRAQFPRGIDIFLTCGDAVMALPRSTKLSVKEA